MLNLSCDLCKNSINEPGSLLFVPKDNKKFRKYHFCCSCSIRLKPTKEGECLFVTSPDSRWNCEVLKVSFESLLPLGVSF